MKPLIGVTTSVTSDGSTTVGQAYLKAVLTAGGIPVVLPNLTNEEDAARLAASIDGLLLTGGGDIDPTLFNEEPKLGLGDITPERDCFEMLMIEKMLEANKPVLAICRGIQILSIACGGDMFQDIYRQHENKDNLLQHQQHAPRYHASHFVDVPAQSLLGRVTGAERFKVNSYHHQAVRRIPDGFRTAATASDGVIEAIESERHAFVLGVQWHPEGLLEKDDPASLRIFKAFVAAGVKTANPTRV